MGILDGLTSLRELRHFDGPKLNALAEEIRGEIISTVSRMGGHLASSLGVVELTVALHSVFSTPEDKIVWDVGHQCYAHKILTGRHSQFHTLRQLGGISGFPKRRESPHDCFGTGHSSTSISAALGFAAARDLQGKRNHVVAVIGDGALTGGMAFEGLNQAGSLRTRLVVVLNDNEMSISKNVGALASHLSNLRMDPRYVKIRRGIRSFVRNIPGLGRNLLKTAEAIEEHLLYLMLPEVIFESFGFIYLGPFDGHNVELLRRVLWKVKQLEDPVLVHVVTRKGRGYLPAEKDVEKFHGAAPFNVETGEGEKDRDVPTYTEIFGSTLVSLAKEDRRIVAITAAMKDGTGLRVFSQLFPTRFFDVGIAEQHAVTFAAGLAAEGLRPVVALYSTFMQRGFDQVIHDVCLQRLPVVFALDRAGIVGEDGSTHQGVFDLSFMRLPPCMTVMAPKDENELRAMLKLALLLDGPSAIRYPRGKGVGVAIDEEIPDLIPGKAEVLREGEDVAILAIGNMVYPAILASEILSRGYNLSATVVNMRFVKPLDEELLAEVAAKTGKILTVEENSVTGGFAGAVLEALQRMEVGGVTVRALGIPDFFLEHGSQSQLREQMHLYPDGIVRAVIDIFEEGSMPVPGETVMSRFGIID
jgi:1-deoxy-D-xylulose-5-phosphate synthase